MRIKPTMSHAVDKAHLNELLVKYYEDLASEYDKIKEDFSRKNAEIESLKKENEYLLLIAESVEERFERLKAVVVKLDEAEVLKVVSYDELFRV